MSTPSCAYLTHDHLGSTRGMWDGSIAQMGTWEFDPYGAPYHLNGPAGVTQLYTGHDLDPVRPAPGAHPFALDRPAPR